MWELWLGGGASGQVEGLESGQATGAGCLSDGCNVAGVRVGGCCMHWGAAYKHGVTT
jgi:hypothetical protein